MTQKMTNDECRMSHIEGRSSFDIRHSPYGFDGGDS